VARGRPRIAALAAVVAFFAVVAPPAHAQTAAGGPNHVVLATTAADCSALGRSGLQVAPTAADTVASANIARALAHDCTGCRSAAVAFQAVLMTGDPHTVVPGNAAVAENAACNRCVSFAFAFQYDLTTPGPVRLSLSGLQEIQRIRDGIAAIADETAAAPQADLAFLNAQRDRLDALGAEFQATIDRELLTVGAPAGTASERFDASPAAP
jgi:putative peptide zinc metalloprotease protein